MFWTDPMLNRAQLIHIEYYTGKETIKMLNHLSDTETYKQTLFFFLSALFFLYLGLQGKRQRGPEKPDPRLAREKGRYD